MDSVTKSRKDRHLWGVKQTYLLCLSDFFSQADGVTNLEREMYVKIRFFLFCYGFCCLIRTKTQKHRCKLSFKYRCKRRGRKPIHCNNYIKIKQSYFKALLEMN